MISLQICHFKYSDSLRISTLVLTDKSECGDDPQVNVQKLEVSQIGANLHTT